MIMASDTTYDELTMCQTPVWSLHASSHLFITGTVWGSTTLTASLWTRGRRRAPREHITGAYRARLPIWQSSSGANTPLTCHGKLFIFARNKGKEVKYNRGKSQRPPYRYDNYVATVCLLRSILLPEGYLARQPPSHFDIMSWTVVAGRSLWPYDMEYPVLGKQPKYEACEHCSHHLKKKKEKEKYTVKKKY